MDWLNIIAKIRKLREDFDRSSKCLNKSAPISNDTKIKHLETILVKYNEVRVIILDHNTKLSSLQLTQVKDKISRLRENILYVSQRHKIQVLVPNTLYFPAELLLDVIADERDSKQTESKIGNKMAQSVVNFLKTASSLLFEYDGKAENLQCFKDALNLLDSIKGEHETLAVNVIKTKLKGHAKHRKNNTGNKR